MESLTQSYQNLATFLKESWHEVRWKVTWPTSKEVWGTTLVVVITVVVFAAFLGALDKVVFAAVDKVFAYFA